MALSSQDDGRMGMDTACREEPLKIERRGRGAPFLYHTFSAKSDRRGPGRVDVKDIGTLCPHAHRVPKSASKVVVVVIRIYKLDQLRC